MSSDLKDARWQLAEVMAKDDNRDFHGFPYAVKAQYLDAAQRHIERYGNRGMIKRLAAEFREPQEQESHPLEHPGRANRCSGRD